MTCPEHFQEQIERQQHRSKDASRLVAPVRRSAAASTLLQESAVQALATASKNCLNSSHADAILLPEN